MKLFWIVSTLFIQTVALTIIIILCFNHFYTWTMNYAWPRLSLLKKSATPPKWLLTIFVVKSSTLVRPHARLYQQAGFFLSYPYYIVIYRAVMLLFLQSLACIVILYMFNPSSNLGMYGLLNVALIVLLLCETFGLKLWINYRKKQIIYDIYQLSYHLLYFSESSMNIYSKLKRCLPYTTALKRDIEILLIEWTQDTDYALTQFKERLACHEAISFIDTVHALKQHQDEAFYHLLRERITEYKEQLELAQDSKKETASYILFILAGIPILYTFQVFIYPWVKEVQRLLLNMN